MCDEVTPTLRQVVAIVAAELDHELDVVSLPYALATPAHPLTNLNGTYHRYMPSTKLTRQLGYRDVVGFEDGLRRTARWLAQNPPAPAVPKSAPSRTRSTTPPRTRSSRHGTARWGR